MESYGARFTRLADAHPNDVAIVMVDRAANERTILWRELEDSSRAFGHLLREHGVGEGSLVMVALRNSAEHFFATIGALKVGATIMPLRSDVPKWESDRYVAVAEPSVIVSEWRDRHQRDALCLSPRDVEEARNRGDADTPLPDAVAHHGTHDAPAHPAPA
jgi:acyl-coenzyme A synthetase/AMP-(fatty) acid ligase